MESPVSSTRGLCHFFHASCLTLFSPSILSLYRALRTRASCSIYRQASGWMNGLLPLLFRRFQPLLLLIYASIRSCVFEGLQKSPSGVTALYVSGIVQRAFRVHFLSRTLTASPSTLPQLIRPCLPLSDLIIDSIISDLIID